MVEESSSMIKKKANFPATVLHQNMISVHKKTAVCGLKAFELFLLIICN